MDVLLSLYNLIKFLQMQNKCVKKAISMKTKFGLEKFDAGE
jgi:hypothetical protein